MHANIAPAGASADPEAVGNLTAMGFSEEAASAALVACNGSLERAADWLFSHMDDLDAAVAAVKAAASGQGSGSSSAAAAGGGTAPADRWVSATFAVVGPIQTPRVFKVAPCAAAHTTTCIP